MAVEFRPDRAASGPVITAITPDGFRLEGLDDGARRVRGALLMTPVAALPWTATDPSTLTIEQFQTLTALDPLPEFVLLGTGPVLVHPPRPLVAALAGQGIGLEVMDSRAAARAWSVLRAEDRWIAAALLPPR